MSPAAPPHRPLDPPATSDDRPRTPGARRCAGRSAGRAAWRAASQAARRTAFVLAGLVLAVLGPAQVASAHARLVRTDPGDGTRLTRPPAQATFTFDDPIGKNLARAELSGPRGKLTLKPQVDGRQVHVPLPDVAGWTAITGTSGTEVSVMITYRVVSADGHPVSGQLRFTVPVPAVQQAPTGTASESVSPSASASAATTTAGSSTPSSTDPSPTPTKTDPTDPLALGGGTGGARWAVAAVAILAAAGAAVTMIMRRRHDPGPGRS